MESPVGLVPTMGALHAGHEALLRAARTRAHTVIASLFVNPTQFAEGEDFAKYPRSFERDLEAFERDGVDFVFAPDVEEMYPEGATTFVDPGPIGAILEGHYRPGHFRGVATVVTKLFGLIRPDFAVFGEKDAQQLVIVRRLVRDLLLGVEIVGVRTVRAPNGLALSSRNAYLSEEQSEAAAMLRRGLREAETLWGRGVREAAILRSAVRAVISEEPALALQYVSVADPESLEELDEIEDAALVSLAARIGKTRLIDNVTLR